MSFNAWMPLQGTKSQQGVGGYQYSAAKNRNKSKGADKAKDDMWKLAAESYQPSAAAQKYSTDRVSSKMSGVDKDVKLSDNAKKLLKELKEKYSNMDFFVASYSSDEEAQSYLGRGTKEYSVLLDPETLEAMANDADVRKQYEDVLAGAGDQFSQITEQLGDDADKVKSFGITIGQDGKVSYFAELDKISESRKEQVESAKEKRTEEKAKATKKAKKEQMKERAEAWKEKDREFVKADSVEQLISKIKEAVRSEEDAPAADGIDVTL